MAKVTQGHPAQKLLSEQLLLAGRGLRASSLGRWWGAQGTTDSHGFRWGRPYPRGTVWSWDTFLPCLPKLAVRQKVTAFPPVACHLGLNPRFWHEQLGLGGWARLWRTLYPGRPAKHCLSRKILPNLLILVLTT